MHPTQSFFVAIVFSLILSSCIHISAKVDEHSYVEQNQKAMDNPFIHHVYFYLKNPNNLADRDKLVEGLEKLSKVSTIQRHYIGFPASTDRPVIEKGYAVSWMCMFKNLEEEEQYQQDPIHLKFIEEYGHLWGKVVVYDSVQ